MILDIEPHELHGIVSTVSRKIDESIQKVCDQQLGIISHWRSTPIHIHSGALINKSTGNLKVSLTVHVIYYYPQIGSIVSGVFQTRYDQGLFFTVLGKIKVFVPIEKASTPFYNKYRVPLHILETRYKNNHIDCIAEIIE